jgi:tRNA/rRNA methyltransferase
MNKNSLKNVSVVLVRPQMGENIGAAARAMANFGLSDLRIVDPRDGWPNERAQTMAAKAFDGHVSVQVFDTVDAAIAESHYVYATTARKRDMLKDVRAPTEAAEHCSELGAGNIALVFGAERTGLTNEEAELCHSFITIPTDPDFSSLNLGQSVLLLAYEFSKVSPEQAEQGADDSLASVEQVEAFLSRLDDELEAHRFFQRLELRPSVMGVIRTFFLRSQMREQEVRTMQGVLSALIGKKGRK